MEASVDTSLHRWVNAVTIRGGLLVVGGLVVLSFPNASTVLLRFVISGVVVGIGLSDLWASFQRSKDRLRSLFVGIATLLAGLVILVFAQEAVTFIVRVLGVLVVIRGAMILYGGIRSRNQNPNWLWDIVRGVFYLAAGGILLAVPEAFTASVLVIVGVGVIILGAILVSFGITNPDEENVDVTDLGGLIVRWFQQRDVGDDVRANVVDTLYFEPPDSRQKRVGFWTLLILSVIIATLGVLADSTAVVIGAMLVAPLMTPIMGVSAGIVNGWMRRVSIAFATVAGGVIVAIIVAFIVSVWTPNLVPIASNGQITSRISPTMIDMLIACAAGAAGAYATVDDRVSSSITGVAIAVALVPPLGVVGVMIHAGDFTDALGAFLLFSTNLVSIVIVASAVFLVAGLAPIQELRASRDKMKTVFLTVVIGAMVVMIPLAFTSQGILVSASRQGTAQDITEEWLSGEPRLKLDRVTVSGSEVDAVLSGEGTLPSIADLQQSLEEELGTQVKVFVEYFPSQIETSETQSSS